MVVAGARSAARRVRETVLCRFTNSRLPRRAHWPAPPEAARLQRWWDEYRVTLGGLEVTADPEMPFVTRVDYVQLGAVGLGRSSGSINRFYRGPHGPGRDADDRFQLVINRGDEPSQGVGRGWRKGHPAG